MSKQTAFLRAINVGGHTVKMDYLRELFLEMGFRGAETFIASGNVIFEADTDNREDLEKKIEKSLTSSLGYNVAVFIRSVEELKTILNHEYKKDPGFAQPGSSLYIAFLEGVPDIERVKRLLSFNSGSDNFHINGTELYWICSTKISESPVSGAILEKTLGMKITIRNSTTVRKICDKYL